MDVILKILHIFLNKLSLIFYQFHSKYERFQNMLINPKKDFKGFINDLKVY